MTRAVGLRRGLLALSTATLLAALVLLAARGTTSGVALPTVLGAGFIDGLNPCAVAVLLIFVSSLLATVERGVRAGEAARLPILIGGGVYVGGLYVTYLAIGVGLLSALGLLGSVALLQQTHIVGRVAALLAVGLGVLTLQEVLIPEWGQRLVMPPVFHERARRMARWVSLPGLFVAGAFIGVCTVPCSGSVYLATVTLLSRQTTYLTGLAYLALYNVMFVTPLLALLAFATARPTYRLLARAQLRSRAVIKLALAATTIGIGLLTLAVM